MFWHAKRLKQNIAPTEQIKEAMAQAERGQKSTSLYLSLPLHFLVLHACAQHLAGSSAVLQTRPLQPEAVDPWLRSLLASRLCRLSFRFLDTTSEHCTLRLCAWKSESAKFRPPSLRETSLARFAQVGNYVCPLVLSSTYRLEFLCQIISFSLHLHTYHCNNSANNERATNIILALYPVHQDQPANSFLELL